MIRKVTLQIAVPTLLALMAWNAFLAINHLNQMQKIAALTLESSAIQAGLSGVLAAGPVRERHVPHAGAEHHR